MTYAINEQLRFVKQFDCIKMSYKDRKVRNVQK